MARLPATGQAVVSLYEQNPESEYLVARGLIDPRECVTTLADAIAGLRLAPLTTDDEQKVRRDLQRIPVEWKCRRVGKAKRAHQSAQFGGHGAQERAFAHPTSDSVRSESALEGVIGCAVQEEARLQVAAVQKAIRRAARTLNAVAAGRRVKSQVIGQVEQILHGRQTGLHSAQEISAANEVVTALAGIVGDRDVENMMPNFVLVHGAWHGRWCAGGAT